MIRFRRANRNLGEQGFTPEQKSLPEPPAGRTLDAGIMFQLMLNGPAKTMPLVWRQAAHGHLRPARFVFHPYPARFRINFADKLLPTARDRATRGWSASS